MVEEIIMELEQRTWDCMADEAKKKVMRMLKFLARIIDREEDVFSFEGELRLKSRELRLKSQKELMFETLNFLELLGVLDYVELKEIQFKVTDIVRRKIGKKGD